MFSRRYFLVSSLAALGLFESLQLPGTGKGVKPAKPAKKSKVPVVKGPHILSRLYWSPAVSADFVAAVEGNACLIADQFGRITIVDLGHSENNSVQVIGELAGVGKHVGDLAVGPRRAVALVKTTSESSDSQFGITVISLYPTSSPTILTELKLERFAEAKSITLFQDTVCVAGVNSNGDNIIAVFSLGRGKTVAISQIGTGKMEGPIGQIDLQDRQLAVLLTGEQSKLSLVSLANPASPQVKNSIALEGQYTAMGRQKDLVLLGGADTENKGVVKLVSIKPALRVVSTKALGGERTVDSIAAHKEGFLVLTQSPNGRSISPFLAGKGGDLEALNPVSLPKLDSEQQGSERIATNGKSVYVASGWSGVQTAEASRSGVALQSSYTIPRLPASGLALWANLAVVAGADLSVYDLVQPAKPNLVKTAKLTTVPKAIVGAGSFLLCLDRDSLALRKIENLDEVVTSTKIAGRQICFDSVKQCAFVMRDEKKKTIAQQFNVYSNRLVAGEEIEIGGNYARAYAHGGYLLVGELNDLTLFGVDEKTEKIGTRHFDNLAIRDFALNEEYIFATAVDEKSKGFFIVLTKDKDQLKMIGSIDLPHDGAALAVTDNAVTAVGRNSDGKDLATIINIASAATPKITASLPAIESASAVAIKGSLAVVAGRGLEVISIT